MVVVTDRELIDLFAEWRRDIDSVPYAHEETVSVAPKTTAGWPVALAATIVVLLVALVVVSQVVAAVTP